VYWRNVKLRVSTYLVTLVAGMAVIVWLQNWAVGAAFLVAGAATVLPLYWMPVPKRYFYIPLFAAATLFVTHLARVPFLVAAPDLFLYPRVGAISADLLATVLLKYALYSGLLFAGIFWGFRGASAKSRETRTPSPRPVFLRASAVITCMSLMVFAARSFLQLGLGLHTKNVANPTFGFLGQLLPADLLYPVCILYLAKYRARIPLFEVIVFAAIAAGMIGLTLVSGSRRSFAAIGFALFIYFLAQKGNFKLGVGRALAITCATAGLLMLSFALAEPIRGLLKSRGTYNGQLLSVIGTGVRTASRGDALAVLGNAASRRISLGMDGMVAVELYRPDLAVAAFSPKSTGQRALAKLVPRYQAPGNAVSSGQVVGMAYLGMPVDVQHASALGLLASLNLTFGRWISFLAIVAFGALSAAYFRLTARLADADLVYLLHFLGMQILFSWISSGNLDGLLASTATYLILFTTYAAIIAAMINVASLPSQRYAIASRSHS
jgi:hypothetical protein